MYIANQAALREALARPRYEIVPIRGAADQARWLPASSVVTVTCSPQRGMPATIELAEKIQKLGCIAVPHLAARRFASRSQLEEAVERLTSVGIRDVFVVGGDGTDQAGPFARGADLIEALAEIKPDIRSVGIPCYPEGHAFISAAALDEALDAKSFFAGHMVTQLCFDTSVIRSWLERIRARGVGLPVYLGIPGVMERRKLLGIALRIGLGDSTRFLKKNTGFFGQFAGRSSFSSDGMIEGLADMLGDAALGVRGLHINTFNQIESTETWRKSWLDALDAADGQPQTKATVQGTFS